MAASVALHVAILAVLALQHPQLHGLALPPQIFEVTVAPLYLVEPKARQRQASPPIRPRPARLPPSAAPIAPLYAPPTPVAPSPAPGFAVIAPPAAPPPLSQTLRRGGLGCPNADAVGLSRAERDRCLERLGAGSRNAAYLGQGLSHEKQRLLDQVAAQKKAYRDYKEAPIPPGLSTSDAAGGISGLGQSRPTTDHRF